MPSEKVLELKKQQVAALKERLDSSIAGVVVDYKGISVEDDTKLRKELREAGVEYTVVKNTILGRAIDGTSLADMSGALEGTTAIATSKDDYVAAARILGKYAEKSDSFKLKTGYLDGEVIGLDKLDSLAKLPSRETLLSMLAGALLGNISKLAVALNEVKAQKENA